ncbi:CDP-alcohol phosphatidyltransferase family protein [Altererythrobacter salegens]|uniref:CDP-alcohol phosphatidyltransferase family protein n=1 Tax=Croceibacterium salegens TaxID=1737568 RepID=A0A6I4SV41_9SPHN|nr:CDP-alcohol phosphatidyltransferase family protein [Croceibacterium salegens]MXO59885.1 CDP-alcohol phosphatidyltransferase family protein [Croceibacterium salegens]
MSETEPAISVETVGANPVRMWGLDTGERVRRMAAKAGLGGTGTPVVLVNADHAFDPAWLGHVAAHPGMVVTLGGVPVLAHARNEHEAAALRAAIRDGAPLPEGITATAYEDGAAIENKVLRKRERPFLTELTADNRRAVERASYFGAYKGVTDLLTKYLWPELALWLTRFAAWAGLSPNAVSAVGAVLCVAATVAFAHGHYWLGMAMGFVFMVLDTVDGKLARCTITSSKFGDVLDHGIDLVHPPFWWWFWATGLATWGLALSDSTFWWVQGAIVGGYVLQRLIEGAFIAWFGGIHIHVWERFDSRFRLITARRNPNMVVLFVALLFGRPDIGIVAVAVWTVLSCAVHLVRLVQAVAQQRSGRPVTSWLAQG